MGSQIKLFRLAALAGVLIASASIAHDTWVQPNTNIVRVGDAIHLDLMLGNHGNEHRDFKLAGKPSMENSTLVVIAPDGKQYDLKSTAKDLGYAPQEGYWTTRFQPDKPGLYLVAEKDDKVVTYAPTRSIHSAKTFFVATPSLEKVPTSNPGFDRVLGHALELVPQSNPVTPMGPGTEIKVQVLFQGKPMAGARVSFVPRGQALSESFDERFERKTDEKGMALFEPTEANYYLIVAHHADPDAKGEGYTSTKYSATLTVFVPAICPCCE
jgi:uncharacterized GH25 family protein